MQPNAPERTEVFLRHLRGTLYVSLLCLALFSTALAILAVDGDGTLAPLMTRYLLPLNPLLVVIALVLNARQLKGLRLRRDDPAMRAVLEDEHRKGAFQRATRSAFIITLVAQVPLAALFMLRPTMHLGLHAGPPSLGPVFMGVFTLVIGVGSLIGFFLFFDRE